MANLSKLPFTRKPESWADVKAFVYRSALPAGLPVLEAAAIDGQMAIDPVAHRAAGDHPQYFLVEVEGVTFLVNTEGYGYVRYASRVAEVAPVTARREPLPTGTPESPFGFFGTMSGIAAELAGIEPGARTALVAERLYASMSRRLLREFKLTPEQVREYLDSRSGRHLADAIGTQEPEAARVPWLVKDVADFFGRQVVPQAERHASVNFRCAGPLSAQDLEAKIADALRRAGLQVTAIEIDKEG